MTRCDSVRHALSAALDGETSRDQADLDRHVAGCAACRAWVARVGLVAAATRDAVPLDAPDLTGPILAGYRAARRRVEPDPWLRWSLVLVAAVQLAVALPGLLAFGTGVVAHAHRDLGAWDTAFAIGLLYAARRPDRATGLVPFAVALAGVLTVTSTGDIVAGRVPGLAELPHALALFGLGLLWNMTHPRPPHLDHRGTRDRTRAA